MLPEISFLMFDVSPGDPILAEAIQDLQYDIYYYILALFPCIAT